MGTLTRRIPTVAGRAWGRYLDRWSRRDGRWGVDARITLIDFDEIRDVTPLGRAARSSRHRDDPSYAS